MSNKVKLGIGVAVVAVLAVLFGTQSDLFKGTVASRPAPVITIEANPAFSGQNISAGQTNVRLGSFLVRKSGDFASLKSITLQLKKTGTGSVIINNLKLKASFSNSGGETNLGSTIATPGFNTALVISNAVRSLAPSAPTYVHVYGDIGISCEEGNKLNVAIEANGVVVKAPRSSPKTVSAPAAELNLSPSKCITPTPLFTVSSNASVINQTHFAGTANALLGSFVVSAERGATVTSMAVKLGGVFSAGGVTNLTLKKVNSTDGLTQLGTMISAPGVDTSLNFSISPALVFPAGASVINVYGDLASSLAAGSTISLSVPPNAVSGYDTDTASATAFSAPSSGLALQTVTIGSVLLDVRAGSVTTPSELSPGVFDTEVMKIIFTPNTEMEVKKLVLTLTGSHSPLISKVKLFDRVRVGPADGVALDSSGKATFVGLTIPVAPSGLNNELTVRADILPSSFLPFGTATNPFANLQFGIMNVTDVAAIPLAGGQMVNASSAPILGQAFTLRLPPPPPPPPPPTSTSGNIIVIKDALSPTNFIAGSVQTLARFHMGSGSDNRPLEFTKLKFSFQIDSSLQLNAFELIDVTNSNRSIPISVSQVFEPNIVGNYEISAIEIYPSSSEMIEPTSKIYELRAKVNSLSLAIAYRVIFTRLYNVNERDLDYLPSIPTWSLTEG